MVCTRMQARPAYAGCTPLVCCFRQRSMKLRGDVNAFASTIQARQKARRTTHRDRSFEIVASSIFEFEEVDANPKFHFRVKSYGYKSSKIYISPLQRIDQS